MKGFEMNKQLEEKKQDSFDFCGKHVFGELYGVDDAILDSIDQLEKIMTIGIENSQASCLGLMTKKFKPNGVTRLALLSESHASIHTYPEHHALFIDAFTCGTVCDPMAIINTFIATLKPNENVISETYRGLPEHNVHQKDFDLMIHNRTSV